MADLIDHIEALSANIGPRPVSTEEEHQASCYVAQELTDAGLEVDMDEFATPSGVNWPFGIAFTLMIVGTVLSGFGMFLDGVSTAFLAVGLVLLVIGAIIYFAEHSDHPLLSNAFNRGVSQNVVAKYVPSSLARENRRRKVIIVAHVDTVRSELQANPTIVNFFPTYTRVLYYTTIGLLALLVIRLFPIPWPDMVDLVLWILSLVGCLVPLAGVVCIVAHKLLPYVEGANDNASGVAVMLDVAHRILDPQERERLAQERSEEQPAEGAADEDEETLTPQPVVHDAESAAAAGVVAEGAELEYATDARDASRGTDADAPDATKVMPALDADAATEVKPEAGSSAVAEKASSDEPADEDAASGSVLEYPHSVSEAAIGSSRTESAAEAEQTSDDAAEVVDADYEDAAVAEVNDAEREARSATLDEAQTAMQPRPHPKHEPAPAPEPQPEPEPDPSMAGMPAWYVAARQQAAREKPASDESDAEAVAASRSRYADIPLEGVSDLAASEEVADAEAEVAEEEAPEQPLEEPPSAYVDTEDETSSPAAEEEAPEEAPAAEPDQSAESDTSAASAPEQSSVDETATPAAAESVATPAASETSDTAESAAAEAAAPASAEPATPAPSAAEEAPTDESAAPAAPSAEEPSSTEAAAPQTDEAAATEQGTAQPESTPAEAEVPASTAAETPAAEPVAAEAAPAATPAPASEKTPATSEAAAESEPATETATSDTGAEEPESPAADAASEAARELPTRIPAIGSSGSVSSRRRVSQLRSELENSIADGAKGSEPVARTRKDTKDAAPARRKPTARRVTEAFQPTKAVEDREEGFTGVTQAAAVSSTYEGTPQAGATSEPEFDPFAPSSVPESAAAATPQPISPSASSQFPTVPPSASSQFPTVSPSASSQFPTVSPSASSQFPTVSPSASSQFPTVSPSASTQFPTVSPSASTQFPTVPASAAVNPSDFGAPAAPADSAAPAPAAPAPAPAASQADFAAPTNPAPTAMPTEPEPVDEYATLDPEIAVPQSRFRDALDGVAGAFGRIGRRNRRNQDREIDYGGWSNNEEASGGNDNDDEDIGWKGGAYYDGEEDGEMPDAAFDDADESMPPADDAADGLHPGRSGSFDPSAIDSARARAAEIRESIVTMTEHDLLDKEVWFVALGASSANNRGMRNFLDLHATELRGSLIINLEGVGACDICYVDLEGRGKVERADRRLQTLVRKASKDLGEVMSAETLTWRDTDATPAMRAGLRAMTIMGFDGVAPTAWHWHTDTTLILDDNALDYTTRLILKMIENS